MVFFTYILVNLTIDSSLPFIMLSASYMLVLDSRIDVLMHLIIQSVSLFKHYREVERFQLATRECGLD